MKRNILFLFLCFLPFFCSMAKSNKRDYVLCVNSYNFATPWSNRIVQTLSKRIQAEPNLMLHVEHMRSLLINDEETYNNYTTDLLKN